MKVHDSVKSCHGWVLVRVMQIKSPLRDQDR